MTATGKFMDGASIPTTPSDTGEYEDALVEMRLHFEGYEGLNGRAEGRDASGVQLFSAEMNQILGAVPCFTASSCVATGQGLVTVSDLTPGTRVITRDNGMQELLWVGQRRFGWRAIGLNPFLRPVRIAAGALGLGLPERDMVVSPNHRFLTRLPGEGESGERLAMARDLVGLDGIGYDRATEVVYWQLLFARHELVLADGCWSESFQPTEAHLDALGANLRASMAQSLPGIGVEDRTAYETVRPIAEIDSAA